MTRIAQINEQPASSKVGDPIDGSRLWPDGDPYRHYDLGYKDGHHAGRGIGWVIGVITAILWAVIGRVVWWFLFAPAAAAAIEPQTTSWFALILDRFGVGTYLVVGAALAYLIWYVMRIQFLVWTEQDRNGEDARQTFHGYHDEDHY